MRPATKGAASGWVCGSRNYLQAFCLIGITRTERPLNDTARQHRLLFQGVAGSQSAAGSIGSRGRKTETDLPVSLLPGNTLLAFQRGYRGTGRGNPGIRPAAVLLGKSTSLYVSSQPWTVL